MSCDVNIMIAGQAGQGLVTISGVLLKTLARSGHHVFATQDYMSRVRGGHNFMRIRAGAGPFHSVPEKVDVLAALDQRSVEEHEHELTESAIIIYDSGEIKIGGGKARLAGLPIKKIATDTGNPVYANSVALGALMSALGLGMETLEEALEERFGKKGKVEDNIKAARAGFSYLRKLSGAPARLGKTPKRRRMLVTGAELIGLGMIAGGLRLISAYPMSPSTGIFTYITAAAKEAEIISEQAEDEIAAINTALGASAAGARSAVTTSGGGLALMTEGVSLAGITETPVLIANIQRPGPATGLPTRTAQEDLDFVLSMGHGEFPRMVYAPGTAQEAYHTAIHAMNMADKYQTPVFLLGDQHLVDSYSTIDRLNTAKVKLKSFLAKDGDIQKRPYLRYRLTKSGVSPRARFGQAGASFMVDCHVHTEDGHITEDAGMSARMAEKRMAKLNGMRRERFGEPKRYGHPKADVLLMCWGSAYGAVRDTVDWLNERGVKAAMIHFNKVWPFPAEKAKELIGRGRKIHVVENNIQSQFARLLKRETGIEPKASILRYDGRPFNVPYIAERLKEIYVWRI